MNVATRQLARTAVRAGSRPTLLAISRQAFRQADPRFYSSQAPKHKSISIWPWVAGAVAAGGAGGIWYLTQKDSVPTPPKEFRPTKEDYQKVYDEIASRLEHDEYDDGSYGPVVLRLAWHASGPYDKETNTGGSNGATMRFAPEAGHKANNGMGNARDFLEPVEQMFPWISYSDLWILGGVCAVQKMQGPAIPFRPGRHDADITACTPGGRLPNGAKGAGHVRDIFSRMGFSDREMTALIGAHALGRCHADRSGYSGPWTFSPTVFSNDFFTLLAGEKWAWKKWDGPKQYEDERSRSLMMLPADMAFVQDEEFRKYVELYAKDIDVFYKDFATALVKLFELGVPFYEGSEKERMFFKPLWDRE